MKVERLKKHPRIEIEIKDPGELNNSLELKLQGQKRLESAITSIHEIYFKKQIYFKRPEC